MYITLFIGGIILFIYSINSLTDNLSNFSLPKIKDKLLSLTSSTTKSITLGFLATILIQSSSAIIILTISLINTNVLNFNNSIGILLGSNIATTVTSFIIGLNLEKISAFIMLIGFIGMSFKNKFNKIAKLIFNIGLLFYSLFLMSLAVDFIKDSPIFYTYIQSVSNSFILSLIVGTLITIILQSSSVFIAILQLLALSNILTLPQIIPFIFGANIGTTIDSFYGYFSCQKESKKLAHFNLYFNIITVIFFSIFITPFKSLVLTITNSLSCNIAIDIAITNIIFNILGVLIILPFLPKIKRYYSKW